MDQVDNACTITTEMAVVDDDNNGSSSRKKSHKKEREEKRQKGEQEEMEQLETDTVYDGKSAEKEAIVKGRNSVARPVTIEYSKWQKKLLIKGINNVKNNNLRWRFTVANALRIPEELIDHGE